MIFKCIQCERDITALRFHSAIAVMSGKYHIPAVRVTPGLPVLQPAFFGRRARHGILPP